MRHLLAGFVVTGCLAAAVHAVEPTPDPVATRLLADARAARATWNADFPGFTADVVVNFDGQVSKGQARVSADGKVTLTGLDKDAEAWVRRQLGSQVVHRFEFRGPGPTPCAFADDHVDHPLGRLIRVLNDELHSSYRIRDDQIMVVNRQTTEGRFAITMQENRTNAEGKFLPVSYCVHYWDADGRLTRSEAHYNAYQRVGVYDLPATVRIVYAGGDADGQSVKSLTLSAHQLLKK
jgi:hypothetical protein